MNDGTMLRELSSVGSERLPYKQRVGGSTPSAPTKKDLFRIPEGVFFDKPEKIGVDLEAVLKWFLSFLTRPFRPFSTSSSVT